MFELTDPARTGDPLVAGGRYDDTTGYFIDPTLVRLIWALNAIGRADDDFLLGLLNDESEYVRAWAIRLLTEDYEPPRAAFERFAELAATDPSAFVCLHLASAFAIGRQAAQRERHFAALAAQGIGVWLGFQALVNMGVNMGLLPTKGLTLPLVSYGGSGLLANFVALAILLRIDWENRQLARGLHA